MPYIQFQFRRGSAAEWFSANPVLASGELGLEQDTRKIKIGDGVTHWNDLLYGVGAIDLQMATEVGNTTNLAISITNNTVSSNTVTGAFTVTGGAGIGGNLNLGSNLSVSGTTTVGNTVLPTGNGVIDIGSPTSRFGNVYVSGNNIDLGGTSVTAQSGNLYVNGDLVQTGNIITAITGNFSANVITPEVISNGIVVTVNTSFVPIDEFIASNYTTAKYIIQTTNGSNFHSTEAFLVNDGSNAWLTVYASLSNNGKLIDLDTSLVSGNVQLLAKGLTSGNSVKIFVTRL